MDPGGICAPHAAGVGAGEDHASDAEISESAGPGASIAHAFARAGGEQSTYRTSSFNQAPKHQYFSSRGSMTQ